VAVALDRGFWRGEQPRTLFGQVVAQQRAPVVGVAQHPAVGGFEQVFGRPAVMDVGGAERQPDNHAWPADAHMRTQAEEPLACPIVIAPRRPLAQATCAMRPSQATHRHRQAVDHRHSRVKRHLPEQMLPQPRLDLPQVRCLAYKRHARHLPHSRKPLGIVPAEVAIQPLVGRNPQVRTHYFHRQHFAVGQHWLWSALPYPRLRLEPVINLAVDRHQKRVKIHRGAPCREVGFGYLNPSKALPFLSVDKLVHRVSQEPVTLANYSKLTANRLKGCRMGYRVIASSDRRPLALLAGAAIGALDGIFALLVVLAGPVMAFGALIGLAAGLYVLTSLQGALYAMFAVIALLPFANLPFDLGVTPTLLDGALGAFLLVYFLQWMSGRRRLLRTTPLTPIILLFIGIMLFAFLMGLRHAPLTARV